VRSITRPAGGEAKAKLTDGHHHGLNTHACIVHVRFLEQLPSRFIDSSSCRRAATSIGRIPPDPVNADVKLLLPPPPPPSTEF
jgi:hypothetical protein